MKKHHNYLIIAIAIIHMNKQGNVFCNLVMTQDNFRVICMWEEST